MLQIVKADVYQCVCEACSHPWSALKLPTICPSCRTRSWNGIKSSGRKTVAGPRILKHYEVVEDRW